MNKTKIEWTEETWNPITGCTKVSAGCKNCYAEKMANRLYYMLNSDTPAWQAYAKVLNISPAPEYKAQGWNGEVALLPERLTEPFTWRKPRKVFVNSMSDLFHEKVPTSFIESVFEVMSHCKQHTFQVLTKRPKRMLEIALEWDQKFGFPDNVWMGVSVEDQPTASERIPYLMRMPAKVKYLSIEPLLNFIHLNRIYLMGKDYYATSPFWVDWVIVGCETGTQRRECKLEWIENIVEQCKYHDKPVFVKKISINGKIEKDINKFPAHLRIREYPTIKI